MNKNLIIIVLVLVLIAIGFTMWQEVNPGSDQTAGGGSNGITGGVDFCFGPQCEGKKEVFKAEAEAIRRAANATPIPMPTEDPSKTNFTTELYNTGTEVAPVLGWGLTTWLLLTLLTIVVCFVIWFVFVWLPNQKKKPVAGVSGKLLSLEFQDGGKLLGDANTVGATHWQQGTDKPIALQVDPEVAISADANAAFRDASLGVGKMITRNQLLNNAASQMQNLLGATFDGVANVRAAGVKPDEDQPKKKKDGDPPIITIK